jgi:hypothetical protein
MRLGVGVVALFGLVACIDHPDAPDVPDGSPSFPPADSNPQQPSTTAQPDPAPAPPKDPKAVLKEVVYVLMDGFDGDEWMCTGTLVSKDRVITAAHCLEEDRFTNWRVVAPLIDSKPRVSASRVASFSNDFNHIENPDIGFLALEDTIDLPAYGELTDITERVEKSEKFTAVAIVREEEKPEAPFKAVTGLALRSTTDMGYEHGFGAPLFSHGGDSGAGIFLVENGQPTHKLVGVARQPDPDSGLDHFTRIDRDFLDWFEENTEE